MRNKEFTDFLEGLLQEDKEEGYAAVLQMIKDKLTQLTGTVEK